MKTLKYYAMNFPTSLSRTFTIALLSYTTDSQWRKEWIGLPTPLISTLLSGYLKGNVYNPGSIADLRAAIEAQLLFWCSPAMYLRSLWLILYVAVITWKAARCIHYFINSMDCSVGPSVFFELPQYLLSISFYPSIPLHLRHRRICQCVIQEIQIGSTANDR